MNLQNIVEQSNSAKKHSADRWNYIDLIESIGILFVMIYHSTTYQYDWLDEQSTLFHLRYFLRTILSTCVPLFFLVNGYLLLNREFDLRKHILKSVRIVFLTVLWGVIGLVTIMHIEHQKMPFSVFINNLWTWGPIGWINHLWYMGALICIYGFLPLIKDVYDTKRHLFYYFTIAVSIFSFGGPLISYGGSIAVNSLFKKNIIYNANAFNIFNPFNGMRGWSFVYFCVGGLMHTAKDRLINMKHHKLLATGMLILNCSMLYGMGIYFSRITGTLWDVVWNGYDTIFTFFNTVSIFILASSYNGDSKLIKAISTNTLGIFFMHRIFIHLTKNYIVTIPALCTFTGNFVYAIGLVFMCLCTSIVISKIPVINNLIRL